jgi:hypothetical protein
MNKWDDGYDEKLEAKIRIIKEYDLVELSLVDTPANEFANILSIEKVNGVDTIKSSMPDTVIENVFWDEESGIVMLSENEQEPSPNNGVPMKNIGFVEKTDNEKSEMIKFLVDSAKGINTSKIIKEESPMNETTNEIVEEIEKSDEIIEESQVAPEADAVVEDATTEEVVEKSDDAKTTEEKSDDATEDVVEKTDQVEEESAKVEEVSKSDEVAESVAEIKNTLTSAFSDLVSTIKSLQSQVEDLSKSVDSVKNEVAESKGIFDEFGKRVDAVEADTAFRKSGDLGEIVQYQPEKVEKSLWGGRFLKTADLFK